MVEPATSFDFPVETCLETLGISLLREWDVLVFLYRHRTILASSEQIARLLGYPGDRVAETLDSLESLKLIRRSRACQGGRLHQLVSNLSRPESCFQQLLSLGENRSGRFLLAQELRQPAGSSARLGG